MEGSVTVSATGDHLRLRFPDGMQHRFHAVWLRDNIADTSPFDSLAEIPVDVRIRSAKALGEIVEITFAPDGVSTHFPVEWLKRYAYDADQSAGFHLPELVEPWDSTAAKELCNRRSDKAGRKIHLNRYGVVFVQEFCARAVENTPSHQPGTVPYTAHPFLATPPRHSLIRLCKFAPEPVTLRLLDGFHLAELLRDKSLSGFDLLSRYPLQYRQEQGRGITEYAAGPVFRIAPDGQLQSIRYDSRHVAPVTEVPYPRLPPFYAAYRQFVQLIKRADLSIEVQLQPGEGVLLDNHRLLRALPRDQMHTRQYITETQLEHCGFDGHTTRRHNTCRAAG